MPSKRRRPNLSSYNSRLNPQPAKPQIPSSAIITFSIIALFFTLAKLDQYLTYQLVLS